MFGLTEEQLNQIKAAASGITTPTPTTQTSSSSSNDLFSKIGTPTWNYAYNDNRAASITGQDGKEYFFVPQSYVQKGLVVGNFQEYNKQFLDPSTFQNAVAFELPQGLQSRLESKGFVWSADDFNKLGLNSYSGYNIDENNPAIVGIGTPHPSMQVGSPTSYITQPKLAPGGERVQQDWITPEGRFGGLGQYSYYRYQGPLADLARGALQSIGPLAPLLLEYAAPGMGLGSAYVAGNAAGKLATGQPGAAETLATSAILSQLGVGSGVAEATGSTVAGQVAQGTATGLLTGKTPEQAITGAVKGVAIDNLLPTPTATVPTETQAAAGQQDLMGQLAPYESTVPKDTTAFDTTQDISDTSGFNVTEPSTPITPISTNQITGNTGGTKMPDYTEDPYGYSGGTGIDSGSNIADPYALLNPTTGEYEPGAGGTYDPYTANISEAVKDYAKGTGLKIGDVINFFKSNPTAAKALAGAVSGGVGLFGSALSTKTAQDAAKAAADAMKFKPVGVTTRFGTTDYTYDPEGNLKTAGYTLTPELKAIQDKLMSGATLSLDEAKKVADLYDPMRTASASLFDLGKSYLAKTPEQVAADYMAKQQNVLAPSRERQLAQLQNTLFQQGRGGLSVGGTSARPSGEAGLRAASPEMEAYYNALAQQDAQLAANAQQAGQQSVLFGKGLLSSGGELLGKYTAGQTSAYDPFKTLLSTAGTVEGMGGGALDIGAGLGGRTTTAATNAAKTLMPSASVNPYGTLFTSLADDPQFKAAIQSYISGGAKP